KRTQSAADFDRDADFAVDALDHLQVRRCGAQESAVEVDDVKQLRAGFFISARHFQRVAVIDLGARLAPLGQPHAATAFQIDCGNNKHNADFSASVNST